MNKTELKNFLCSINPEISSTTIETWWVWSHESEDADSCQKTVLPGSYKTAEMFLNEFASSIQKIRNLYGDKVALQVISLADIPACPNAWELMMCGKCFAEGKTTEEIVTMEEEGTLENFRDYLKTPSGFDRIFNFVIKDNDPYRQQVWILSYRLERRVVDPEAAIRAAVKDFINSGSEKSKQALEYAAGGFNWGDVMSSVPDEYFVKYGLTPLNKQETIDVCVDHDEVLE